MVCKCQICGRKYKIDFLVPNDIWQLIKPEGKSKDRGLMCGICIMEKLEKFDKYGIIFTDISTIIDIKNE